MEGLKEATGRLALIQVSATKELSLIACCFIILNYQTKESGN